MEKLVKETALLCFLLILSLSINAQILAKIDISNPTVLGYGAHMSYILNESAPDSIQNVDTFSEFNILKVWGMPLMTNHGSIGSCRSVDTITLNIEKFFKKNKRKSKCLTKVYSGYMISITFLKIKKNELCTTPLDRKYWGCCDFYPEEAGLLTTMPKSVKMDKEDMEIIKRIKMSLDHIVR